MREQAEAFQCAKHRHMHRHRRHAPWNAPEWAGPRARRGDVKYQILGVLAERPSHGYDIMRALEAQNEGYRASPGSVYPTLQMLEDGGFATSETVEGKRVFTVTQEGRVLLEQRDDRGDDERDEDREQLRSLRQAMMKLAQAVIPAARTGDAETRERIRSILDRARREIYAVLSEDAPT